MPNKVEYSSESDKQGNLPEALQTGTGGNPVARIGQIVRNDNVPDLEFTDEDIQKFKDYDSQAKG